VRYSKKVAALFGAGNEKKPLFDQSPVPAKLAGPEAEAEERMKTGLPNGRKRCEPARGKGLHALACNIKESRSDVDLIHLGQ
jgi:hypothetical protein